MNVLCVVVPSVDQFNRECRITEYLSVSLHGSGTKRAVPSAELER